MTPYLPYQSNEMDRYMDIGQLNDAICLKAYCNDDNQDLKTAIILLVDEAYMKGITPSYIDFNFTDNNELTVTLYGYPRPSFQYPINSSLAFHNFF